MKNQILKMLLSTCLIGLLMIWISCEKESDAIELEKVDVSFNVSFGKTGKLKATKAYELIDAEKVILTIQKDDGTATDYTQYELNIHRMGTEFITKKIALPFGSYQITEFYIIDNLDSIIFASPLEGSLMAQNMDDPLPVIFDIVEKKSKAVDVEVLSTEKLAPEDFGLVRFPIIEVETFQFLINVSEIGTDQLLIADLTVTNGSYSYSQEVDSIVDNIVTVKDGYVDYILTIESEGYQTYADILTNSELKAYDSIPLVVELPLSEELTVTDIDGNIYNTIVIGNQVWMAENLKVTRYRNGDAIPNVTSNTDWENLNTGAYCNYNNDDNNAITYGSLYNWYAIDDSRNIAPTGWHVPSDDEWKTLEIYLGMSQSDADAEDYRGTDEGGKLKETGTVHWNNPDNNNIGATNESGFTALPGGYRGYNGFFNIIGNSAYFYPSTEFDSDNAWYRTLTISLPTIRRVSNDKRNGFSVRCIKD